MDLHKEWKQLNDTLFSNQSLKHDEIMNAITSESSSVITELKKGLKIKSYWCLFFVAMFAVLMFISRDNMEQVLVVSIVTAMYIVGFFGSRKASKDLDANISNDTNVLSALKQNSKVIKRAMNNEKGIFLYNLPVIIICSLFYGRMASGSSFTELTNDPKFLILIIVMTFILVPLGFLMGKYLNSKSFSPLIAELDQNINKLEGIEMVKEG